MKNATFRALARLIDLVLQHRVPVVSAVIGFTCVMAYLAAQIEVKTVFSDLLPRNHPYVEVNNQFKQTFGGSNMVSIMLEVEQGDVFNPTVLKKVQQVTQALQKVEGVDTYQIASLASKKMKEVRASTEGIESRPLMWPGLPKDAGEIATLRDDGKLVIEQGAKVILDEARQALHAAWSATSIEIQRLRDNPDCADAEFDRVFDDGDVGLTPRVLFDATVNVAAPMIATGSRPKVAILREQGVNSHVEMAYAFTEAGFEAFDVHMTDLQTGRAQLADFKGVVACGGFSYGDTLGAGEGWARSILFNAALAEQFAAFFNRPDTLALGVCNGCQMMAALAPIIPGTAAWPRFTRNKSEQFEARLSLVEVLDSPSLFFTGMAGSRLPIAVAHGEGFADFSQRGNAGQVRPAMRFVDHRGAATEAYPFNPNGSPGGLTSVTTDDGRFTVLMPHPERVFRQVQMSWQGGDVSARSPWMRMFQNARRALG